MKWIVPCYTDTLHAAAAFCSPFVTLLPPLDRNARDEARKRHEDQGIPFFEVSACAYFFPAVLTRVCFVWILAFRLAWLALACCLTLVWLALPVLGLAGLGLTWLGGSVRWLFALYRVA